MKKESIMVGVIGLLLGIVVTGFTAGQAVNNNNTGMMRMMGIETSVYEQNGATDHSTMSMADMSKQLEGLTGDDFDKAFIEMMIEHHEGAIDMAKLSPSRANHAEVKELSKAIIIAQEKEILQMYEWQSLWGYTPDESMQMMHGGH